MKPQDILFIILLLAILWKRNPVWAVIIGLLSLILAVPLFQLQIFFTAERLVMYAFGFILIGIMLFYLGKKDRN